MLRPSPAVWTGETASNAWLQETPEPFTKQVWGNALWMNAGDAAALDLADGDLAEIASDWGRVRAPVLVVAGQAAGTVAMHLGYGRRAAGPIGSGVGVDANPLRPTDGARVIPGVSVAKAEGREEIFRTQLHFEEHDRDLLRTVAAGAAVLPASEAGPEASFYPPKPDGEHAWGMVIDLDACIGCNACVTACQAENNVPVVGPEEVARGRIMHWLRVDAYVEEGTGTAFQPVPCMHCEQAPCEPVCPVAASVHDAEGLNVQVYNRCVGTRFCQANCPYKVRRFNFFGYADGEEFATMGVAAARRADEPGRHGARARGDGEMHLLRAAHRPRAPHGRGRGPADGGGAHRLPVRLSDAGDRLRRSHRRGLRRGVGEAGSAELRHARSPRHPTAYHVSRAGRPGRGGRDMTAESAYLPSGESFAEITAAVADPVLEQRFGLGWWIGFGVAAALTLTMVFSLVWLVTFGVGIWGINTSNVWGFAIANYVWWIGIGNAGTLISSMLLLTRQRWRASISRFAEAMTLFAAAIAGLFPIFHLGRPWLFYWLVPYPDTMTLLPQWNSPLVWDFFAIASYLLFSLMFWYTGALPDFASLRDRASSRGRQRLYGILAFGWRGSARHWQIHQAYYGAMACLGVPLVISVHSVVGLDFAAGMMPGWNETVFPPYFVVGAMYSGFAMVVVLAAAIRRATNTQHLITIDHFDVMARILLMASLIMTASYATEWFFGWYSGETAERGFVRNEFTGAYAPFYWTMLACNCGFPLLFVFRAVRRSLPALIVIAVLINVGMWLERILIINETLSHAYVPSEWTLFWPTVWDWLLLAGTLGFFAFLFYVFVRVIPAVSIHEVKARTSEARA